VVGLPLFDDGVVRRERYCLLPHPGFVLFGFRRACVQNERRSRLKVIKEEHCESENQASYDGGPYRWDKYHCKHRGGVASAHAKENAEANMENIFQPSSPMYGPMSATPHARLTPSANSSRTPPSPPRASAHSRASGCDLCGNRRQASTSTADLPARHLTGRRDDQSVLMNLGLW